MQTSPEDLEAYLHLTPPEIARIVLYLLVEEAMRQELATFRSHPQDLPPQPAERLEELIV